MMIALLTDYKERSENWRKELTALVHFHLISHFDLRTTLSQRRKVRCRLFDTYFRPSGGERTSLSPETRMNGLNVEKNDRSS
ncbi:hypothetical protein ACROYT_G000668 [Oculina patagonica]